jgi:molybdenum cofactor sulfurtransferase
VKYPLRWIQQIKAKSTDKAQWRVLVDAAAYVPTQPLDLRKVNPDFVSLSFYKMFGYPTVRRLVAPWQAYGHYSVHSRRMLLQ